MKKPVESNAAEGHFSKGNPMPLSPPSSPAGKQQQPYRPSAFRTTVTFHATRRRNYRKDMMMAPQVQIIEEYRCLQRTDADMKAYKPSVQDKTFHWKCLISLLGEMERYALSDLTPIKLARLRTQDFRQPTREDLRHELRLAYHEVHALMTDYEDVDCYPEALQLLSQYRFFQL